MHLTKKLIMITKFISTTRRLLVGALSFAAVGLASCEKFFEYEGDCEPHYYVSFVYDMNMLYADAFGSRVSSVDLYIFDAATDEFVGHYAEDDREVLRTKDYMMPIYVAPGKYRFVAWCGLANNEGRYTVPDADNDEIKTLEELTAVMARQYEARADRAFSNVNLDYNKDGEPCALYHGTIDASLPDLQGTHVYPIQLTKDTNNIIVSIWHRYGELDKDHYEIKLEYPENESNATLHHTNAPLADENILYRPWSIRGGKLDLGDVIPGLSTDESSEEVYDHPEGRYITAEISTSRLMADHNPHLVIYDTKAQTTRLDVPLIKQIKAFRSFNYSKMTDQEYLDRQDEFSVAIILDSSWAGFEMVINGWHVMDQGDTIF